MLLYPFVGDVAYFSPMYDGAGVLEEAYFQAF